jgi:hypothetical protein
MPVNSGFWKHFILSQFCSNSLIILVVFLQIFWITEFTRQNSQDMSAFFFPFPISHITLNFFFDVQNLPLFATVTMLSLYQFPVNNRSRKGRATLGTQCITVWILLFIDVTQHRLVDSYRQLGTAYQSHLQWSNSLRIDDK